MLPSDHRWELLLEFVGCETELRGVFFDYPHRVGVEPVGRGFHLDRHGDLFACPTKMGNHLFEDALQVANSSHRVQFDLTVETGQWQFLRLASAIRIVTIPAIPIPVGVVTRVAATVFSIR